MFRTFLSVDKPLRFVAQPDRIVRLGSKMIHSNHRCARRTANISWITSKASLDAALGGLIGVSELTYSK
jgi:hypothetical protein